MFFKKWPIFVEPIMIGLLLFSIFLYHEDQRQPVTACFISKYLGINVMMIYSNVKQATVLLKPHGTQAAEN
jgi:hypothetical protein